MIRGLMVFVCVAALAIVGINAYLAPDDLRACGTTPDQGRDECQKADAIVAVSGGKTAARTAEAITLYKNGWANYLIFSGAAKDTTGPSNAAVMKQQALAAGVPERAIITENESQTTHQNAERTDQILREYSIYRLIVVTSPYHQRRAGLEFQNKTDESITILNHPAKNDPDWPSLWWLTPRGWWLAVGELVKITATHAGGSE